MVVSGPHLSRMLPIQLFLEDLRKQGIGFTLYTDIPNDPTIESIEKARQAYLENRCDCLVAIGGGSILDAGKAIGILVSHPDKTLPQFRGLLKIRHPIPLLIAVPTTAGTGSEATVASVISDKNDKYALSDPKLIPSYAILDNELLVSLSPRIIADTGMDAFCHAIEAYIGHSNTAFTKQTALSAMVGIRTNLLPFYQDALNPDARDGMLLASYRAGVSFTRAYVGYVHALAHAIGGQYHIAHGRAIAILLPYVLESYGSTIDKDMLTIYDALSLGPRTSDRVKARKAVIGFIRDTNRALGIEEGFHGLIQESDMTTLAKHADKEANPFYPVPREENVAELLGILRKANR